MSFNKLEIKDLIHKRENIYKSQESLYILDDYVTFLSKNNYEGSLVSYINEELIDSIILECFLGEKIFSIDDLYQFYITHKQIIYSKTKRFFLSSRDSSLLNNFYQYQNKVWNIMDISFEIIRTHDFEKFKTFQNWLKDAISLIDGSEEYFIKKDYKNSLRELQRAVETLVKAYSLYMGLKKEEELYKKVGHLSINVYIDLLNENWITKAKDLFKLKTDIKKSIDTLKTVKPPKIKLDNIKDEDVKKLKDELKKWDQTLIIFIDKFKKIDYRVEKKFSKKGISYAVNRCKWEFGTDIKSYYKSFFGFSGLLFPLAIITQFYQSKFSYTDMSSRLNLKYENLNLIKYYNEIISLLRENIEYLKKSYRKPKKASYTLLSETLKYKLEPLLLYPENKQKIELINKNIQEIKKDDYIQNLISKIKTSKVVDYVKNEKIIFSRT
jgi:hypothetical protein